MERYSSRGIDELGRIVLHSELRNRLGLETGDKVSLLSVDNIVILQRAKDNPGPDYAVSQVSELGMIELPAELRQKQGWKERDRIALYNTDNLIILKLA